MYSETFGSEAEALAFISGMETAIDCLDSDHLHVDSTPLVDPDTAEWTVTYDQTWGYRSSC